MVRFVPAQEDEVCLVLSGYGNDVAAYVGTHEADRIDGEFSSGGFEQGAKRLRRLVGVLLRKGDEIKPYIVCHVTRYHERQ